MNPTSPKRPVAVLIKLLEEETAWLPQGHPLALDIIRHTNTEAITTGEITTTTAVEKKREITDAEEAVVTSMVATETEEGETETQMIVGVVDHRSLTSRGGEIEIEAGTGRGQGNARLTTVNGWVGLLYLSPDILVEEMQKDDCK